MDTQRFLEKVYTEINDNIKFSEAKNAALITLNSALIAGSAEMVFDSSIMFWWRTLIAIVILSLLLPTVVALFSFYAKTDSDNYTIKKIYYLLSKKNNIDDGPEKLMYYAYISKYFKNNPEVYLKRINNTDKQNLYNLQLSRQIVDLSAVAYNKFLLFNIAVKLEAILFIIGGVFAFGIVIVKTFLHL